MSSIHCPTGHGSLLSSSPVRFTSLLIYKPKPGPSDMAQEAAKITYALKRADGITIGLLAEYLREEVALGNFGGFLGPEITLVPAPGHAPRLSDDQEWATRSIAQAMEAKNLGTMRPWLKRTEAVQKSAYAAPGERPTWKDHQETIEVTGHPDLLPPECVTVVDDVVTTGSTLYACVRLLEQRFPDTKVQAFAAVRTMSDVPNIQHPIDPVQGEIVLLPGGDRTKRSP